MPAQRKSKPGVLMKRLTGLETWSTQKKSQIISAIANDISAVLMCIGKHAQEGNLSNANTEPIDCLIEIIHQVDANRPALERKTRRLRKERRLLKQEFRKMMKEAEELAGVCTEKLDQVAQLRKSERKELQEMKRENEILRLFSQEAREGADDSGDGQVDESDNRSQEEEIPGVQEAEEAEEAQETQEEAQDVDDTEDAEDTDAEWEEDNGEDIAGDN